MRYAVLRYMKIIGVILALFLVGGYGYYRSHEYLRGPVIAIYSPENGSTATTSHIVIRGNARNATNLLLNDREISVDTKGDFSDELLLPPGYTIIMLKARDRFDRERIATLELVHIPMSATTSVATSTIINH